MIKIIIAVILWLISLLICSLIIAKELDISRKKISKLHKKMNQKSLEKFYDLEKDERNIFNRGVEIINQTSLKFINVYNVSFTCIVAGVVGARVGSEIFQSLRIGVVTGLFMAIMPWVVLNIIKEYNQNKMNKQTAHFLTYLMSWIKIKNDLLFAFRQMEGALPNPIKSYVQESIVMLEHGIENDFVFSILAKRIGTEQFKTVAINFASVYSNGGDITTLISMLEIEAYKIDDSIAERRVELFSTKIAVYFITLLSFGCLLYTIFLDESLKKIYVGGPGEPILFYTLIFMVIATAMPVLFKGE